MTQKHTPTPIALPFSTFKPEVNASNHKVQVQICTPNGCPIAYVENHRDIEEYADFIVRACNAHEDLVTYAEMEIAYDAGMGKKGLWVKIFTKHGYNDRKDDSLVWLIKFRDNTLAKARGEA